jgi:hypothetical protein
MGEVPRRVDLRADASRDLSRLLRAPARWTTPSALRSDPLVPLETPHLEREHSGIAASPVISRRGPLMLVLVAALVLTSAAAWFGAFRAEDWLALELGDAGITERWREVWTTLWHDAFYRPVTDTYQAVMFGIARQRIWPYLMALILLFALHTWMLARIARLRGAPSELAWLVAAAAWAQVNAYAWTTLWMSNVGGSLAATFTLAALLFHHRIVVGATRGQRRAGSRVLAVLAVALGTLSKEEIVTLPAVLAWLEAMRWRRLDPDTRRAALTSWATLTLVVGVYVAFRLLVMPSDARGTLRLGSNWPINLAFFTLHLGPLPLVALIGSRVLFPAAWRPEARRTPGWNDAWRGMAAGFGWTLIAVQVFLPFQTHGYGYLYTTSFGVALAVAYALHWAAGMQAASDRAPSGATVLVAHWLLMLGLVAIGLIAAGWPRYRSIEREAFAVMDRVMPDPPRGATILFLDPDLPETMTGRSLFNMVFDGVPGSVVRGHYRRNDLAGDLIRGPAAWEAARRPPPADLVLFARQGRLTVVAPESLAALAKVEGQQNGAKR